MHTLGQLAVRVKVLEPGDSLGKAAEASRTSTMGAAPVVEDGRLLGVITASTLAEVLVRIPPSMRETLTVASVPMQQAISLPSGLTPMEALQVFQANGLEFAPVIDPMGHLAGMVSRADLVTAVCGRIKPPVIGGMATPFGVYLTGGGVRGGVGDWALVSTGAYLGLLHLVAVWVAAQVAGPAGPVTQWIQQAGMWAANHIAPQAYNAVLPLLSNLNAFVLLAVFGLLFRLSWVTGYHAAEHQVVHAMEAGDDLRPEVVAAKPRVHPRCGTNLVMAVFLMCAFWRLWPSGAAGVDAESWLTLCMIGTLFLWRKVGSWVQQHVTTRKPTPEQLESGIFAARQLLERYQQRPYAARSLPQRIWNMGLLQVLGGSMLVVLLYSLAATLLPLPPTLRDLF